MLRMAVRLLSFLTVLLLASCGNPIDTDNDGFVDKVELEQGTNPNDATDYPDIIAPTLSVIDITLLTNNSVLSVSAEAADEYSGLSEVTVTNQTTGELVQLVVGTYYEGSVNLAEGTNVLVFEAKDNWNNTAQQTEAVNLDSTAPVLVVIAPQASSFNELEKELVLEITDENSGVASVYLTDSNGTSTLLQEENGRYSKQLTFTEGNDSYSVSVTDAAGNNTTKNLSYFADVTAPEFSNWVAPSLTNVAKQQVSIDVSDALSDIASVTLQLNSESQTVTTSGSANELSLTSAITLSEGTNTVLITATDELGNSSQASFEINLDTQAPVIKLTSPVEAWFAENSITVSGSVSDENSGVASFKFYKNGVEESLFLSGDAFNELITVEEGENSFLITTTDTAGNESEIEFALVSDTAAPVISSLDIPELTSVREHELTINIDDAYLNLNEITLTVNSVEQAVTVVELAVGAELTASIQLAEGLNSIVVSAADVVNNVTEISQKINLDTISPVLTIDLPAVSWVAQSSIVVSGSVTDENSGLALSQLLLNGVVQDVTVIEGAYELSVELNEALNDIQLVAEDTAGNSATQSLQIGWDSTAPAISVNEELTAITNQEQWLLSGTVTDDFSGLASLVVEFQSGTIEEITVNSTTFETSISLEEGENSGLLVATDVVGNQSSVSYQITKDTIAPMLTLDTAAETYTNVSAKVVSFTANDSGTGIQNIDATLNGSELSVDATQSSIAFTLSEGQNTLSVTVTDAAGNSTTGTIVFVLDQNPPEVSWLSASEATSAENYFARWSATDASGIASGSLTINGTAVSVEESADQYQANITLAEGSNTLVASAIDNSGNTASASLQVTLDSTAPVLSVSSLPEITGENEITISGTVEDASTVTVTVGGEVVSTTDGSFSVTVQLTNGNNKFDVQALDALSNLTQSTVSTVSDQQGPALTANVEAETNEETIQVIGAVTDALSDITSVQVINQTIGVTFNAQVSDDSFAATIVLNAGINELTVIAKDSFGNTSQTSLQTEYLTDSLEWTWLSHSNNQEVTDESIVLQGMVETDKSIESLQVVIDGSVVTAQQWAEGQYSVKSNELDLALGNNLFVATAYADGAEAQSSITIVRIEETEEELIPLQLTINSPADYTQLSSEYVTVSGELMASSKPSVTINGDAVSVSSSVPYYYFSKTIQIPTDVSEYYIDVAATLDTGESVNESRLVLLDNSAPVISVESTLLSYPMINLIIEDPYTVTGTVYDENFSSISINGGVLTVTPESDNSYRFESTFSLVNGVETSLQIKASDTAGNTETKTYLLQADRTIDLSWLLPLDNSQFITDGEAFAVQVIAQSTEATTENIYQVRLSGSSIADAQWQSMAFSSGVASTVVMPDGSEGEFEIDVRVVDASDNVLAQLDTRSFTVTSAEVVDVELTAVSPEENEESVDTKESLTLFFNQEIDLSLLSVEVYETAHGKTWEYTDDSGTEFYEATGYELVDVERNYEPMTYELQSVNSGKTILVNYSREPAYGATMHVDVTYNGESLNRYQYQTEELPTLVSVIVRDQYDSAVSGIWVTFEDEKSVTDDDGFVQFGYDVESPYSTGEYQLGINPDLINPEYGETKLTVDIDGGRLNELGVLPIPYLNPEIGSTYIKSGENHTLLDGEVLLDLTDARVVFPDGSTEGSVHIQFNTSGYNYYMHGLVTPPWLFSFQPLGIELSGNPEIQLKLPTINYSYDYLPDDGTLGLLFAVDESKELIQPMGVAERNGSYAKVISVESIEVLDHLGVLFMWDDYQPILERYRDGEISLNVMIALMSELAKTAETTVEVSD